MHPKARERYESLGVDAKKKGIGAFAPLIRELFPGSFCPILRHPLDSRKGIVLHEDGAGTKPIVSYLYWRETGDPKYFETLAKDVIAMNVDDVVCVGATPLAISDYVALNPFTVNKGDLLISLAKGFSSVLEEVASSGLQISFCGGETAELPDIVRTFDVSGTVYAEVTLSDVITGKEISPGDVIVGIRSGGICRSERTPNSGLMCNGITLARHALLSSDYSKKYPEVKSEEVEGYTGRFKIDYYHPDLGMTVGEALLSPTRVYAPLIMEILKVGTGIKALVHNTGGGLTKCLRIGSGILYVKDNLPEPDPIFTLIKEEGRVSWEEMYKVFNMGVGMDVVVDKGGLEKVLGVCEKFKVGAQPIGRCERATHGNFLVISSRFGEFAYGANETS
ncbi:MAG: AIR synthase related protein [Candidatus Methanomethylicaceae archaeon]